MLDTVAQTLGIKKASFLIGLIGAAISLRFLSDVKTWPQRAATAVSGAFAAAYLSPLVVHYFGIVNPSGESGIAFAIGLFGMSFIAAIIRMINTGELGEVIKKRLGGGP